MVSAGRYDSLVRIERATRARNEFGEEAIASWELVAEIWAQTILPNAAALSREIAANGQAATERTCTFRLRWPLDLRQGDRIFYEGEAYGIEGFYPDRRAGELIATGRFLSGTDGR